MKKAVYYIEIESRITIGEETSYVLANQNSLNLQAALFGVHPQYFTEPRLDIMGTDDTYHAFKGSSCIILEGTELPEINLLDCLCFSYPCSLRDAIISRIHVDKDDCMETVMERISAEYDYILERVESSVRIAFSDKIPLVVVMKNLSFGDICVLYPSGLYQCDYVCDKVNSILTDLVQIYGQDAALDTPINLIDTIWKRIKRRLESSFLLKLNPNYNQYVELLTQMSIAEVGSNDRKMYMLVLCSLLLRTILDETAARWVYESGDLKYESVESVIELSEAYELCKTSYDIFLNQAKAVSPYSDQVWSLFFITKTLLSSIVGSTMDESVSMGGLFSNDIVDKDAVTRRQQAYCNFFGFVPFIGTQNNEVMSYYTSHLSPDYCYGFLSIPLKDRFNMWSYFPAYIHEFFHYISPRGRKERNEKILHLAVYTLMNPLYIEMTENRRAEYENLVKKIAEIVDSYRQALIDIRNDYVFEGRIHSPVDKEKVENYRDTMKYNAIMHELVKILDFEEICKKAMESLGNEASYDFDLDSIFKQEEWQRTCLKRWEQDMTSYLATYSFAMREIRSDISMCVILNLGLKEYIGLLANEPAFAEYNGRWVADSTVLRFGFVTRLLYVKEQMGYQTWLDVDWDDLCYRILQTSYELQPFDSNDNSTQLVNTIESWIKHCNKIIDQTDQEITSGGSFINYLENLKEYLVTYQTIMSSQKNEWYSVFERALCTAEYSIQGDERELCCLISNWGKQLSNFSNYSFSRQLSSLYKKYKRLDCDIERCQFENKSRLLFRDLLMAFPNIDLDRQ